MNVNGMWKRVILTGILLTLSLASSCGGSSLQSSNKNAKNHKEGKLDMNKEFLAKVIEVVKPLHTPMRKPLPDDWLSIYPEPGQTFLEYINSKPTTPQKNRSTIYIQPFGRFSPAQRDIVKVTAEYLEKFFNLPTEVKKEILLEKVPNKARRVGPEGQQQILTHFVLTEVLPPRIPENAAALIAFTSFDLWPGEGWNYVFGQASLRDRVGVWSLSRFGNAEGTQEEFQLCLLRTLKLATHETGHMFSMLHCTKYECNLSGTNSLEETDRRPLDTCPECLAKICWATNYDPKQRFMNLSKFCSSYGLISEQKFFEESLNALRGL
jgi:archaemetzincin